MKRNRKMTNKMSVVATNTMRFGTIIVVFAVMVLLNVLSASRCTQLLNIGHEKERELVKLGDDYQRESTRWEEMKRPENVEVTLLRHGLAMRSPRPDQVVRMKGDGTPLHGQFSVGKARQRNAAPQRSQYRSGKGRKAL